MDSRLRIAAYAVSKSTLSLISLEKVSTRAAMVTDSFSPLLPSLHPPPLSTFRPSKR